MSLSRPLFLLFGFLAAPIILLYMLKLRHRPVEVSSILLWQKTLQDRRANTPWQRFRRNLLLLLQLLILAALTLALSSPILHTESVALAQTTIVLLDASASMNATDVHPSRFEEARQVVGGLIGEMPTGAQMTLILAGTQPRVLASSTEDRATLRRALASAEPEQGHADWESALALAAGVVTHGSDETKTVIVSDMGIGIEESFPLNGEIHILPVGGKSDNLAVEAMSVRPSKGGTELYARVTNYGEDSQHPLFSIYRDGELLHSEQLDIPPGESAELVLPDLPPQPAIYTARLGRADDPTTSPDLLDLDNNAYAVFQSEEERRVLLFPSEVSPPRYNLFVEKALLSIPNIHPYRALPTGEGRLLLPHQDFDAYIMDGLLPEKLPAGNLLIINPPENPLFTVGDDFAVKSSVDVAPSPLTRYVDWEHIHVLKAKSISPPSWADVLVRTEGGALIFAGGQEGRRSVVITFDLYESDLPLQVAFPVLLANVMDYLAPPSPFQSGSSVQPGEPIVITPGFDVDEVTVIDPSGHEYDLMPNEEGFFFSETNDVGVYIVTYEDVSGKRTTAFTVNLYDPEESNLQKSGRILIETQETSPSSHPAPAGQQIWPWLAGFGLALLLLEWWTYQRRSIRL